MVHSEIQPDQVIAVPFRLRNIGTVAALLALWALGAVIFFAEVIGSNFDLVMGDRGDARLLAFILEHWFNILAHGGDWRSPPMFYPQAATLGYSDALFGFVPLYAMPRLLGADPLLALQLVLIQSTLIGFAGFVWFARRLLLVPLHIAAPVGLIFAFANGLHISANHGQLFAVHFLPLLLIAAGHALILARTRLGVAAVWAAAFGAGVAGVFFTSYYVGWFFALGCLVLMLTAAFICPARLRQHCRGYHRAFAVVFASAGLGFALAIIPFLQIYLPLALDGAGRDYLSIVRRLGVVSDLWNVGRHNLFWGWILDAMPPHVTPYAGRDGHQLLITPLFALTTLFGIIAAWRAARAGSRNFDATLAALLVMLATFIILLFGSMRIGNWSPWWLVHGLVPGASAISAVFRLQLVSALIAAIGLALLLKRVDRGLRARAGAAVAICATSTLTLLLAAEQINLGRNAAISRSHQAAGLAAVPPPPSQCESFFVSTDTDLHWSYAEYHTEAMALAVRFGLPTLNGYSGWGPPAWRLDEPFRIGYRSAVAQWLALHNITTPVCDLRLDGRSWHQFRP
jgi:hypothetical protein